LQRSEVLVVLVVLSLAKHLKVPLRVRQMLLPLDMLATVQHMTAYDDFSKVVYNSVGVGSSAGQGEKSGGVSASTVPSVGAARSADLGPNVYGKTNNQLDKI
jgi:hypothetical protein